MVLDLLQTILVVMATLTAEIPLTTKAVKDVSIGACINQPCANGLCINILSGGYQCYCKNGFTGYDCKTNYDDCRSNPCRNGASCTDGIASFSCTCVEGYTGNLCETDINECQSDPCRNGAACEDLINGYICNCQAQFSGVNCEIDLSICTGNESKQCENGGTCMDINNIHTCRCLPGFFGDYCEFHNCSCLNDGVCLEETNSTCLCPFGWTGKICETELQECEENVCQNGGICILESSLEDNLNNSDVLTCFCVPDYHGHYCEYRYNECLPEPICNNGATCMDDVDSYSCICPDGFMGLHCENINMCSNEPCLSSQSSVIEMPIASVSEDRVTIISSPSKVVNEISATLQSESDVQVVTTVSYFARNSELHLDKSIPDLFSLSCTYYDIYSPFESVLKSASKHSHQSFILTMFSQEPPNTISYQTLQYSVLKPESENIYSSNLKQNTDVVFLTKSLHEIFTIDEKQSNVIFSESEFYILESSYSDFKSNLYFSNFGTHSTPDFNIFPFSEISTSFSYNTVFPKSQIWTELSKTIEKNELSDSLEFNENALSNVDTPFIGRSLISTVAKNSLYYTTFTGLPFHESSANVLFSNLNSDFLNFITLNNTSVFKSVPKESNSTVESATVIDYISATNSILSAVLTSASFNVTESSLPDICIEIHCENGGTPILSKKKTQVEEITCECICPIHHVGRRCENEIYMLIPEFHGHSFLKHSLPSLEARKGLIIDIGFKTSSSQGIVLFTEALSASSFLMLYVDEGMLKFSFSCGHQTTVFMETHTAVNNSFFTSVSVVITWTPNVMLQVNGSCDVSLLVNGSAPMSGQQYILNPVFDFKDLYVGGIPMGFESSISEVHKISSFTGCLIDLQVNGEEKELVYDAQDGAAITECYSGACYQNPCQNGATCRSYEDHWFCECTDNFAGPLCEHRTCFANPCQHGGTCLPDSSAGYICLCPYGKHGKSCEYALPVMHPSFFGDVKGYSSYIQYSELFDCHYHLEISLKFAINHLLQESLLIFNGQADTSYAAADFFAVGLENGYITYLFNLGSGTRVLRSTEPLNNKSSVNSLLVGRHRRYGWMKINSQEKVMGLASGELTALNSVSDLYIGGHSSFNFSLLPQELRKWKGFKGCIFDVKMRTSPGAVFFDIDHVITGRNILECNTTECQLSQCANGGTCVNLGSTFQCQCTKGWTGPLCADKETPCSIGSHQCLFGSQCVSLNEGYRCDCPLGKGGQFCENNITISDPLFDGFSSFLALSPRNIRHKMDMKISFKPLSQDGLIFYAAQHLSELSRDFVSILLSYGYLQYRFNLGTGPGSTFVLRTKNLVTLEKWHTVEFGRYKRAGYLKLDEEEVTGVAQSGMEILDVMTDFFLGGVPDLSLLAREAVEDELNNFKGCIRLFEVNGKVLELNSHGAISGRNIIDCDGTACGYNTCKNDGLCIPNGDRFECLCPTDYRGPTCETTAHCWHHNCLNGGTCIPIGNLNYTCDCPLGWDGDICDRDINIESAQFGDNSYLYFKDESYIHFDHTETNITLKYSSIQNTGLIFWNGKIYLEDGDYLGLGLRNDHLHLVWSLGWLSRNEIVTNSLTHQNGIWHSVLIERKNQTLTLQVDETIYTSQVSGDFHELNTMGHYYFGGFPRNYDFNEETGGFFSKPFLGCMRDISITGQHINIMNMGHGQNIKPCL